MAGLRFLSSRRDIYFTGLQTDGKSVTLYVISRKLLGGGGDDAPSFHRMAAASAQRMPTVNTV